MSNSLPLGLLKAVYDVESSLLNQETLWDQHCLMCVMNIGWCWQVYVVLLSRAKKAV